MGKGEGKKAPAEMPAGRLDPGQNVLLGEGGALAKMVCSRNFFRFGSFMGKFRTVLQYYSTRYYTFFNLQPVLNLF